MKLKLNNQRELEILEINGEKSQYQGENRDKLNIQMKKGLYPFEELDKLFANSENTKKFTIIDENGEYLYEHYTLRTSMGIKAVQTCPESVNEPAGYEERVCVTLAQKSYRERELEEMRELIKKLIQKQPDF